jgi:hypothetical protein
MEVLWRYHCEVVDSDANGPRTVRNRRLRSVLGFRVSFRFRASVFGLGSEIPLRKPVLYNGQA